MSNKIIKDAKLNTSASDKKKAEPKRLQQTTGGSVGISARAVLLTIGAIVVILACVYVAYDQLRTKVVMTVEGSNGTEKYSMKELGYYIYEGESQGQQMAGMYSQFYGEDYDYWNAEADDNGNTNATLLSDNIITEATEDFILYQSALDNGYEATDDDKKTVKDNTKTAMDGMTAKQKMITGLSEDDVYNVLLMQTVGERYKKDVITSLDLDYDKITKDITKKDYKQYDFEYYYISTAGTETDEDGNTIELTKDEIAAKKKIMDDFAKTVASAEDFSTVLGTDEDGKAVTSNENGVEYTAEGQMIAKDGFADLDKYIKKMKVGEVSDVLKGKDGYYIIKLTDNTSTESYDNAISQAKETAEEDAFNEEYTSNIEPNYTVDVDYDIWDNVAVGSYSI